MNCKTCNNGLEKSEEETEQCMWCALEEAQSDKHCPTCRCNEKV